MAVLFYQSDAPVFEQRQRSGAAGIANDFADDLDSVIFTQPVAFNVEYRAFEDFLRFQQLSWQTLILSRPRYSTMRSFERARRPDFYLEFQAKFLYLFPAVIKSASSKAVSSAAISSEVIRDPGLYQLQTRQSGSG